MSTILLQIDLLLTGRFHETKKIVKQNKNDCKITLMFVLLVIIVNIITIF